MAVKARSGGKRFDYNAVKDIKFFNKIAVVKYLCYLCTELYRQRLTNKNTEYE